MIGYRRYLQFKTQFFFKWYYIKTLFQHWTIARRIDFKGFAYPQLLWRHSMQQPLTYRSINSTSQPLLASAQQQRKQSNKSLENLLPQTSWHFVSPDARGALVSNRKLTRLSASIARALFISPSLSLSLSPSSEVYIYSRVYAPSLD